MSKYAGGTPAVPGSPHSKYLSGSRLGSWGGNDSRTISWVASHRHARAIVLTCRSLRESSLCGRKWEGLPWLGTRKRWRRHCRLRALDEELMPYVAPTHLRDQTGRGVDVHCRQVAGIVEITCELGM